MRRAQLTFGCIVGTRGVFSSELARVGRVQLLAQIEAAGHKAVILPAEATPTGALETVADARKCADHFDRHRREIDGVIVSLPNFGDELGVVNALHWAKLGVPILLGSIAVCRIPRLQPLLKFICKQGFEHHCATARSHLAGILNEAATTYLGWDMYVHE